MIALVKYPLGVLLCFPLQNTKLFGLFILVLLDKGGPVRMRYESFRLFFLHLI